MSFAREGWKFILLGMATTAILFWLAFSRRSWPVWMLAVVFAIVTGWMAYFFRDPERNGERGARLVISPADGRVVMITQVDEQAFIQGRATRISIFMNIFNVHVNRYPVDGVVRYLHYNKGKFINAAHEKASLDNEQMSVGIESGSSRVLVRQIAGLIARRIVNYAQDGDHVTQGARMGIIQFGSRVDVFLPTSTTVRVKVNDLASAGTTVLGELPK
ncbi:MAG: phosphatidylserine decarboxylase family protein [Gemmatimonadota bacterium]|nr:phosphatidylserine decarboxylase family protein [Gemmatimonadota bacterium]